MKQYSLACEQNGPPILSVIQPLLADCNHLLEIGSGTGQHAAYFAPHLPHLSWQSSDLAVSHPSILAWQADSGAANLLPPLTLDVQQNPWPDWQGDAVFSANTLHIMSWPAVEAFFAGVGRCLQAGGVLLVYGPFNYKGQFTSESNAQFNEWLKARDPASAVRDFEAVDALAQQAGLQLQQDYAMPANNRILYWQKVSC